MSAADHLERDRQSDNADPDRAGRAESAVDRFGVLFSLFALYLIWGSTYLGIRIAVETLPPFLMSGSRFIVAGMLLSLYLRSRGTPVPGRRQWAGAGLVGLLLILGGNGLVSYAEKDVASGLAATMIATVPLWAALFAGFWGHWPNRLETAGLAVGFIGVGILNLDGNLRANPTAAALLIVAAASWAFGSIWSRRLPMPSGMMASAIEMLVGGMALLLFGVILGERPPSHPSLSSVLALVYLLTFGSLVAFSAYNYLLAHVRPALATSYAYVNPAVAVVLGAILLGEHVSVKEVSALFVIITGVALVVRGRQKTSLPAKTPEDT